MDEKPCITCVPNGPYKLAGSTQLRRSSGHRYDSAAGVALCRCGGSTNKPFCDGTHTKNGFTDVNLADPAQNRRKAYIGQRITIYDNRALCAHAAFCTDELAAVFRHKDDPWIVPDAASVAEVVRVIAKCPSGALSYAIEGAEAKPAARAPMVTITDNGPYAITGAIRLEDVTMGEGASPEHYTLCRCGASKNKPFCDGSHWDAGFKDPT